MTIISAEAREWVFVSAKVIRKHSRLPLLPGRDSPTGALVVEFLATGSGRFTCAATTPILG